MARSKKDQPPADYPQGPRTVVFAELEEDDWWPLLHALEVRIRFFTQQKVGYQQLNDPGMSRQIEHCDDQLERLNHLLHSAQEQIGATYFRRLAREDADRRRR